MVFNREVMFSSKTGEWSTPDDLYAMLVQEFGAFTLDPASTPENAKCPKFYTKVDDGLSKDWGPNEQVFLNPPFVEIEVKSDGTRVAHKVTDKWVKKAYEESLKWGELIVALLPARTDNDWFHDYCAKGKIWFIRHRIHFGGFTTGAPFPSMIVIWDNRPFDHRLPELVLHER